MERKYPGPQKVTVLGERIFKDVVRVSPNPIGLVSPYEEGSRAQTQTHRETTTL